ncbi:MAG TPA: glycogen debranching N-terminal domain-containing protein [Myxococcales bacterium]|jgi:glycogen debranching enzyme
MGATILHEGSAFVVSSEDGDLRPGSQQGYYFLDTRFLATRRLRLDGQEPVFQSVSTPQAHEGLFALTNPRLAGALEGTVGLVLRRLLGGGFHEDLDLENFGDGEARLELSLELSTDFAFILTIKRELEGESTRWKPSVALSPKPGGLDLRLEHAQVLHELRVRFSPAPDRLQGARACWDIRLARRARTRMCVDFEARLEDRNARPRFSCQTAGADERVLWRERRRGELARSCVSVETDHGVLAAAFDQAARDVASLAIAAEDKSRSEPDAPEQYALAAGIPWYMDLFGRDSLIASYQVGYSYPALARGTLSALARFQGQKLDPVTEEAPGKILHEYRRGPIPEAARSLIPAYPYYGTIDATPLFVIALCEHVRWTGDLAFARALWPNLEAAVEWMRAWGDRDGDGLLEYQRDSDTGLVNQGWKDSTDSVRFRDGTIAQGPIALVEVQGYAVRALRQAAQLAEALGRADEAQAWTARAAATRARLLEAFDLPERGYFAEALDGRKRKVDSLTSNPGHLLWAGVVEPAQARRIAGVLLSDELFSGYGVRTMGVKEGGYNPLSYHNGSVWPHDNALILEGLARYGLRDEAAHLAEALLRALARFDRHRPPELFCGYPSERFPGPVSYPNANAPQAWASGAVLQLVKVIAGLDVDALAKKVTVRPLSVRGLGRLVLRGLPVANRWLDLELTFKDGTARVEEPELPPGWRLER